MPAASELFSGASPLDDADGVEDADEPPIVPPWPPAGLPALVVVVAAGGAED
jgi:hypothetical protein